MSSQKGRSSTCASNAGVVRSSRESITGPTLSPVELATSARDPPPGLCAPIGDSLLVEARGCRS
jgi:hypothetical protein